MKSFRKITALMLALIMAFVLTGCDSSDYKKALAVMDSGDYAVASEAFKALGDYKDSAELAKECDYQLALKTMAYGEYDEARLAFAALGDYKDSAELLLEAAGKIIAEKVPGRWLSTEQADIAPILAGVISSEMGEGADEFFAFCPIDSFPVYMEMVNTPEGVTTIGPETESYKEAMKGYFENFKSGLAQYLISSLAEELGADSDSLEELSALLSNEETMDYVFDTVLGISTDELAEALVAQAETSGTDEASYKGTWEVESGRIKISTDCPEYGEYDFEKDEITLTGEGLESSALTELLYPMTFSRAES